MKRRLAGIVLGLAVLLFGMQALSAAPSTTNALPTLLKGFSFASLPAPTFTSTAILGDTTPRVQVNGSFTSVPPSDTQILLYSTNVCAQGGPAVGTGSFTAPFPNWFATPTLSPVFTNESLYAQAWSQSTGLASPCTFLRILPGAPIFRGSNPPTSPAQPATAWNPTIFGSGIPGYTVQVYLNDHNCASGVIASPTVGSDGSWAFQYNIPNSNVPTTTVFFARQQNPAGDISPCSSANSNPSFASVAYYAAANPQRVYITGTSPASPSPNTQPFLQGGGATPGAKILVFTNNQCIGNIPPIGGDPFADQNGDWAGQFQVSGTTTFYVNQEVLGVVEPYCSAGFTYTLLPPPVQVPTLQGNSGQGPFPTLFGNAPANSTVYLYANACEAAQVDGVSYSDGNGFFQIQPSNPVTQPMNFFVNARVGGQFTPCSSGLFYAP